jgi:hypothetical protein
VKTTFDLVVVDEGHYEPAPSWSRTVRRFDRPTILFSATPFRNDYKSFRVRGRFVYNLPIEDVEKAKIIRTVEFASATPNKCAPRSRTLDRKVVAQVSDEDDSSGAADLTEDEIDRCNAFVAMVAKLATPLMAAQESIPEPKIIVRAASFEALCLIQSGIGTGLQHETVLIHDRVKKDDIRCRRFHTVAAAKKNASSARIWLHESKLLEGIDDPSFVAVAILDPFQNARQLIQQIGRAIRSSDPKRKTTQMATIIAFPEYLKKIEASWVRYRKFEDYCKKNVARVVQSEAAMPDRVMEIMPDLQYVGGEFRDKYLLNQEVQARDIQLPLRVSIFEIDKDLFDIKDANEEVEEAILAEDRFVPRPILGLDENTFGFCYYSWRVSPYLVEQYLSEWSLNVFLAKSTAGSIASILVVSSSNRPISKSEGRTGHRY